MELITEKQIKSIGFLRQASPAAHAGAFPWVLSVLMSTLLLLAENYLPKWAMEDNTSADIVVSSLSGNPLREVCYPIIGLIGIIWLVQAKRYRFTWRSPLALAFGSLLVWSTLSIVWAQEPMISIKRLVAYLLLITGSAGAASLWSHREILNFISISGAAHLTVGVIGEIAAGYFTPWAPDYRFAGTQPWNVQGFCCVLLVLSSLAASDSDRRYKILFRLIALYALIFLILTRSRSSLMGLAAGLLVYFLLTRSLAAKLSTAMVVLVSTVLLLLFGAGDSLIAFLSRNEEGVGSLSGRMPMWELAQKFVKSKPWTGYGYQDFWTAPTVDYFSTEFHWTISAAHNAYLETLLTLGFVGASIYLIILTCGFLRSVSLFRLSCLHIFALASAMFAVFFVIGTLESAVLWRPSPYNFAATLLLWSLCWDPREVASASRWSCQPEYSWRSGGQRRQQGRT